MSLIVVISYHELIIFLVKLANEAAKEVGKNFTAKLNKSCLSWSEKKTFYLYSH